MKKIEKEMLSAINGGYNWQKANTRVTHFGGHIYVYLYDNCIAHRNECYEWAFSDCGWATATTRSRLKALGCKCHIKQGKMIFD